MFVKLRQLIVMLLDRSAASTISSTTPPGHRWRACSVREMITAVIIRETAARRSGLLASSVVR